MAKSSVGFRDSVSAAGAMLGDISRREFAPVYLLMGEEGFFIDRVADALAANILTEAEREFSQLVVYGKDNEAGAVVNFARQMPMLGSRQVVIVKEAQSLTGFEGLDVYVKSPSPTTVLVLCYKGKSVDKRSAVYKSAVKNGVVLESVRPREYEIGPWLSEFVKERGLSIDPRALGMMVDNLGTDIATISNELDKLVTALDDGEKTITADHVQENVGISKEFNNYELTRAISDGNAARALMIAGRLANDVNPGWLTVTLGVMFTHFQRIFILNYQRWLVSRQGGAMPSEIDLMRLLKLQATFFLREYQSAAARFPNRKVFVILGWIREYDMRAKGFGGGSSTTRGELLRELLLKIFAA